MQIYKHLHNIVIPKLIQLAKHILFSAFWRYIHNITQNMNAASDRMHWCELFLKLTLVIIL